MAVGHDVHRGRTIHVTRVIRCNVIRRRLIIVSRIDSLDRRKREYMILYCHILYCALKAIDRNRGAMLASAGLIPFEKGLNKAATGGQLWRKRASSEAPSLKLKS